VWLTRGMRVPGHRQRADTAIGQDARGQRLVALGPAPAGVDGTVEQGQLKRPGRGAFGQDRQVPGGDPAISRPQLRMIGKRPSGQEGRHRRRQVIRPFQGQAGEPEHLHQRPDQQWVLPDAVNLAQQQQARLIQRPLRRRYSRGLGLQLQVRHHEFGCRLKKSLHRNNARHPFSMASAHRSGPPPAHSHAAMSVLSAGCGNPHISRGERNRSGTSPAGMGGSGSACPAAAAPSDGHRGGGWRRLSPAAPARPRGPADRRSARSSPPAPAAVLAPPCRRAWWPARRRG
jgi:hypothetical protein